MRLFYFTVLSLFAALPVFGQYVSIDVDIPAGGCVAEGTYTLLATSPTEPTFLFDDGVYQISVGPGATSPNNFQMSLFSYSGSNNFATLETNSNTDPEGVYTVSNPGMCLFGVPDFETVANNAVLPVTLSSFTGEFTGKAVALDWATEAEDGNEGFEVQRSLDGTNWGTLNFVPAATDGFSAGDYTFLDRTPLPGVNYYRLKQMDFDGAFEFSSIVTVTVGAEGNKLSVFPNPVSASLNVRLAGSEASNYRIFNEAGAEIMNGVVLPNGQINVAELPAGLYNVSVTTSETVTTRRFVKN